MLMPMTVLRINSQDSGEYKKHDARNHGECADSNRAVCFFAPFGSSFAALRETYFQRLMIVFRQSFRLNELKRQELTTVQYLTPKENASYQ